MPWLPCLKLLKRVKGTGIGVHFIFLSLNRITMVIFIAQFSHGNSLVSTYTVELPDKKNRVKVKCDRYYL